ncbi:hypothetical protein FOIG_01317 [Fusarium odoratissimum NRRL 54006]|uniref:Uncharacterized protein n=2 Tax=Fusarium oxysporum species complex TaxID=171631 RepID=X0LTF3_FUSO5|nr:uncharacterized protein FOIG_01317 [Fusarium odoratissimum NRRL 54006]EXM11795.1 hypothetical protein FOIG_01317 [Fusarium odoratissimum NRRL 54006]TXC04075.1 hypothetical protein FocTR4_00000834 [Fusarium oxysporum f. sp. cubense]
MPNTWVGAVRISASWGVKALDAGRTTGRTHADSKREKIERSALSFGSPSSLFDPNQPRTDPSWRHAQALEEKP